MRNSFFLPVVKEQSCDRAKVEFQVQFLAGGPFSSRGEITIMRRFERRVVGGSPAARSICSPSRPCRAPARRTPRFARAPPVGVQDLSSPSTLARSSKVERSPDKRVTTERYRPGQPL